MGRFQRFGKVIPKCRTGNERNMVSFVVARLGYKVRYSRDRISTVYKSYSFNGFQCKIVFGRNLSQPITVVCNNFQLQHKTTHRFIMKDGAHSMFQVTFLGQYFKLENRTYSLWIKSSFIRKARVFTTSWMYNVYCTLSSEMLKSTFLSRKTFEDKGF